jgi:hypothetical protein
MLYNYVPHFERMECTFLDVRHPKSKDLGSSRLIKPNIIQKREPIFSIFLNEFHQQKAPN